MEMVGFPLQAHQLVDDLFQGVGFSKNAVSERRDLVGTQDPAFRVLASKAFCLSSSKASRNFNGEEIFPREVFFKERCSRLVLDSEIPEKLPAKRARGSEEKRFQ